MRPKMLLILGIAAVLTVAAGFTSAVNSVGSTAATGTGVTVSPAPTATAGTRSADIPPDSAAPTPTADAPSEEVQPVAEEPTPAPVGPPVYLTFDDGPDPTITPQVLDLLAANNARATFFVQGSQVQAYPELAARIVAEGHSLQSHAWNHPRLTELAVDDIVTGQLLPTNNAIQAATGTTPTCLRAPFGATGPGVYSAAANVGQEVVGWTLDPGDYYNPGAQAIAQRVLNNVRAGSIVLLHDAGAGDRQQTVDAVAAILPELAARGLQPAALCQ